jgi:hypothetical protein
MKESVTLTTERWSIPVRIGRLLFCGWTVLAVWATPGVAQDPKAMDSHHLSWYENMKASWHHFCDTVEMHRQRVNVWPEPFVRADREQTLSPFRTMVDNGWRLQNTLGDDLFDKDTQELTYAGRLKLRYLMTQFPPYRRQVYVLEAAKSEDTDKRVASVHRNLTDIAPDQTCGVGTTKIEPPLTDGRYADRVFRGHPGGATTATYPGGAAGASAPLGAGTPLGPGTSSGYAGGSNGQ